MGLVGVELSLAFQLLLVAIFFFHFGSHNLSITDSHFEHLFFSRPEICSYIYIYFFCSLSLCVCVCISVSLFVNWQLLAPPCRSGQVGRYHLYINLPPPALPAVL